MVDKINSPQETIHTISDCMEEKIMKKIFIMFIAVSALFVSACVSSSINSVEAYFKNNNLNYPLNIQETKNDKIKGSLDTEQAELSQQEKKELNEFIQHFCNEVKFEECKKWKKDALAFDITNFGIIEDAGKKYFCLSVKAYSNDQVLSDREVRIENTDISVLSNILLFDYDTYEELGWVL